MYWKIIRWGGTAIMTLITLAATLLASGTDHGTAPAQPAATQAQPGKNFNL